MNKELCFIIDGIELYMEKVLVVHLDIPIFFLCKDKNEYFIVLCYDIDNLSYIIVKVSMVDVWNLLHGRIPMRDIIAKQKEFWKVISRNDISDDIIMQCSMEQIDHDILPESGACYNAITEDEIQFVSQFDQTFLGKNECEIRK